jgi:hypothetical protein
MVKEVAERPADATEVSAQIDTLARASLRAASTVTAEEISRRLSELLANPWEPPPEAHRA